MPCPPRTLPTRLAIAAIAAIAATATMGCDDVSTPSDCPSQLTTLPVRDEPSDLYHGTAVACSGDDQTVCMNGTGRWETTATDDCGRTHLSICSDCFASCSCIHLYLGDLDDLDASSPALARVTSVATAGDDAAWGAPGGWVEIAAWAPDEVRGLVALDLGDGWVAATFDWSHSEEGTPDSPAPP
jgi:hypothetical protein